MASGLTLKYKIKGENRGLKGKEGKVLKITLMISLLLHLSLLLFDDLFHWAGPDEIRKAEPIIMIKVVDREGSSMEKGAKVQAKEVNNTPSERLIKKINQEDKGKQKKIERKNKEKRPLLQKRDIVTKDYKRPKEEMQEKKEDNTKVLEDKKETSYKKREFTDVKKGNIDQGGIKGKEVLGDEGGSSKGTLNLAKLPSGALEERKEELKRVLESYLAQVRDGIMKKKHYPYLAQREGMEGSLTLKFTIDRSGKVTEVKLINPCKYNILNKAALKALKEATPFPKFPHALKMSRITTVVPVRFELR